MSVLCCNPIHVDDETNDQELEEIWEYQRNKNMANTNQPKKGGKRRFGMGRRKPPPTSAQAPMRNAGRRSQSVGRMGRNKRGNFQDDRDDDDDDDNFNIRSNSVGRGRGRGRGKAPRPGGLRPDNKRVSISRYVERIDIPPPGPRKPSIAPPMSRQRSRSRSIVRARSRSRSNSRGRNPPRPKNKRGIFGWGKKNKEKRNYSSDESSIGSYSLDSMEEDDGFFSFR